MVGTSAIVAFRERRSASARCRAGTVRAIMGLRGIGGSICEVGKAAVARPLGRRRPYQGGCALAKPPVDGSPSKGLVGARRWRALRNAQAIRFMIKAYSRDFDAIAHFT